ncbi:MAG: helix-turn-helix domain-containing protein [Hyphomonadaceae bacterium]
MPNRDELHARSGCPIATTLDIVGDRWTLVILRDLINGKKRFGDFLASPERITTSVLTVRLNDMVKAGLLSKAPYQQRPRRYEYVLTDKGRALHPVLQSICKWGNEFYPDTWKPPAEFMQASKSG